MPVKLPNNKISTMRCTSPLTDEENEIVIIPAMTIKAKILILIKNNCISFSDALIKKKALPAYSINPPRL